MAWRRRAGGAGVEVDVSLPAGCESATVTFRAPEPAAATLDEGGASIWSHPEGFAVGTAGPGVLGARWTPDRGGLLEAELAPGRYALVFTLRE